MEKGNKVLKQPLKDFERYLTKSTYNGLTKRGLRPVKTIGDLVNLLVNLTEADIAKTRNIGKKRFKEIQIFLAGLGLHLKGSKMVELPAHGFCMLCGGPIPDGVGWTFTPMMLRVHACADECIAVLHPNLAEEFTEANSKVVRRITSEHDNRPKS